MGSNEFSSRHMYLLQLMLKERMFEQRKLQAIHKEIFNDNKIVLEDTIKVINSKVRAVNLKVRKVICEMSGKMMYVLYATVKPTVNHMDHSLSLSEKEFISMVYQGIINSDNGQITTSTALNYCNGLKNRGLKLLDAEHLMNELIKDNLLMYTDKTQRNICFTPLSMVEMETEFRAAYEDLIDCTLCKQIVLNGVSCSQCNLKVHSHCLKNVSTKSKSAAKCPDCKTNMPLNS